MEDLRERQENECIALKSIYGNYFIDLREELLQQQQANNQKPNNKPNKANNNTDVEHPLFKITLFPVNSQSTDVQQRENYVQIDIKVKFSNEYPNEPPRMFLENEKGLSTDMLKTLHKLLKQEAANLKGQEMIFELCQIAQEFLYAHNRPPTKSFYDQRLEIQMNQMEKDKQKKFEEKELVCDEKKQFEDQLLLEIDQAVDLKRKMLQMERKKEKEMEKRVRFFKKEFLLFFQSVIFFLIL
jgi:hypothetical protein